jgi:hypothetical protein
MFHDAKDILVVTMQGGHCQILSICEPMPSLICKTVWGLDALSCHPAIVDANPLGLEPSVKVTNPMQHTAMALLSSIGRPTGHFYRDHGCELSWTLDAVALEDLGKQDAKGQVDVLMRVPDLEKVQCACLELASGNQSGQELPHQRILCLYCCVVALDDEMPWHLKAIPLSHLCHTVQCL